MNAHSPVIDLPSHPSGRFITNTNGWCTLVPIYMHILAPIPARADACVPLSARSADGGSRRGTQCNFVAFKRTLLSNAILGSRLCLVEAGAERNFQLVIYDSVARAFCMQLSSRTR